MKALILAAGLGTRLQPYTHHTPKPLFPINGRPILDRLIHQLQKAGCRAVAVNTHHLHGLIEEFIGRQSYDIPILIRYEPHILGTAGAFKNFSDFWGESPFLVVNSDIYTDIDFLKVYEFHCRHGAPATLVLTDDARFNTVAIDSSHHITSFQNQSFLGHFTFTGIQVIDPSVLALIPKAQVYSSIDAYRQLIARGTPPKAYLAHECLWKDIGAPNRYQDAVRTEKTPQAFCNAFGGSAPSEIIQDHIDGDGSDRKWYRLKAGGHTLILADHGIRPPLRQTEADAFIAIGRHLRQKQIAVPKIFEAEPFAGLVYVEDLGNTHLQSLWTSGQSRDHIITTYQSVLDLLINFSQRGKLGFDPDWTYQTPSYDVDLILDKECRYFLESFLNGYLKRSCRFEEFQSEFNQLAEKALEGGITGLMHRDFQSRNILLHHDSPYAIDFQGARTGPIQYDLASLLIDPYAKMPADMQQELLKYALSQLSTKIRFSKAKFLDCYRCCRITRNLQILGAFGFLSREKGKIQFEAHIPAALALLKKNLLKLQDPALPGLTAYVNKIELKP